MNLVLLLSKWEDTLFAVLFVGPLVWVAMFVAVLSIYDTAAIWMQTLDR